MGEAQLLHHPSGRDIAGSVKGGVDDGDLVLHLVDGLLVHHLGLHLGDVFVVDVGADYLIQAGGRSAGLVRGLNRGQVLDGQNFLGHALVVGRSELGSVLPVYLVAVVLRRIVAGGDIDTRDTAQLAHCEGQLRGGAKGFKLVSLDAVGSQGHCGLHGKFRRHAAGVVGDGHALIRAALLDNVVGQPLGRPSHHIDVHAVDARADHAAQAGGSELQVHIETLFDFIFIARNGAKLFFCRFVEIGVVQPLFIDFHVILHSIILPSVSAFPLGISD